MLADQIIDAQVRETAKMKNLIDDPSGRPCWQVLGTCQP
jgi:hypothetical protein